MEACWLTWSKTSIYINASLPMTLNMIIFRCINLTHRGNLSRKKGQSDIKPTTGRHLCYRPSTLGRDRWTMDVKGGTSTAYTALEQKKPTAHAQGTGHCLVMSRTPIFPSSVEMGMGRNGRCRVSLEFAVTVLHSGGSRYGSSDVDLRLSPVGLVGHQRAQS